MLERFFDDVGGMQLVIHSPYGSRINRAWGLALRKRFCPKFNFELQAAATEDNIVLSLTTAHSFELADVPRYLHSASVRPLLIQALLDAPMFMTRWRWVAGVALALPRFRGGRKVPPQLARMEAEDLIAAIFPDQLACAENLIGEREIPDHLLVRQTIADCLGEAMDIDGLERLLARIEAGEIRIVSRDLTEPSPLALEVLSARPYAYLDDAPLEERRTQAVLSRRWLAPETAAELGRLDPEAIARVRAEAWPDPANADELHDALVWLGFLGEAEVRAQPGWGGWLSDLARERRVTRLEAPRATIWIAVERLPQFRALFPEARLDPAIVRLTAADTGQSSARQSPEDGALIEILRGRLEGLGPVTAAAIAAPLGFAPPEIAAALAALETEGFALRGRFTPGATADEWCERRLLARVHHYTVKRLRAEIEPVAARDFLRFLARWQGVAAESRKEGPDAVEAMIGQLEGFEAPAGAWETEILPARLDGYEPSWLDDLCLSGRVAWARLRPPAGRPNGNGRAATPVRTTPITLLARRNARLWASFSASQEAIRPSAQAQKVADCILAAGASFFDELVDGAGLLRPQVEEALAELVALGLVTSDSFGGLRALLMPSDGRNGRRRRALSFGMYDAGRWALTQRARISPGPDRGRCRRAPGSHPAAPLRGGVLALAGARGGMAAALARPAARLSPARSARRDPRRPLCRRLFRRAVRAARCGRPVARNPAQAGFRRVGLGFGRRSAQPRRHPDPWAQARRADRQPARLPGRAADCSAGRRRGSISRNPRTRLPLAGAQGLAARCGAEIVDRPVITPVGRSTWSRPATITSASPSSAPSDQPLLQW